MQQFINNIYIFIRELMSSVVNAIATMDGSVVTSQYNNFLAKNIFLDNSFIGFNISWYELLRFVSVYIIAILFIVLFIRFIWSLLTIIKDSATKWR